MKVLIIIPAYNEQDNIERVVKHLTENYPEYDYVVINDGSMDKTSEICHSNHYRSSGKFRTCRWISDWYEICISKGI